MALLGFTLILSSFSDRETSVLLNFRGERPIDYGLSLTFAHRNARTHTHIHTNPHTHTRRTSEAQTQSISLELNCLTFSATGTEFIVKERALMDDLSSAQAWQASRCLLPCVFENGPSTYSKDQLGYLLP